MVTLCLIMGTTLLAFFIYHMTMQANDLTSNERCKISDFKERYERNLVKIDNRLEEVKKDDPNGH